MLLVCNFQRSLIRPNHDLFQNGPINQLVNVT